MSHGTFRPMECALSIGEVECKGAVGVLASAIWAVSLVAEVAGHPIEQLVACPLAHNTLTKQEKSPHDSICKPEKDAV